MKRAIRQTKVTPKISEVKASNGEVSDALECDFTETEKKGS